MSAALVTMGRFYGLPATAAGCTSDAPEPGPEAVIEKLVTMLPPASAGADIVVGFGEIQGDQALVLEQILVDNELARYVERLVEGVGEPADPDFVAEIVGRRPGRQLPGQHRHPPRRPEPRVPGAVAHRPPRLRGLAGPRLPLDVRAGPRDRVREILAGPLVDPLPDAVEVELARDPRRRRRGARMTQPAGRGPGRPRIPCVTPGGPRHDRGPVRGDAPERHRRRFRRRRRAGRAGAGGRHRPRRRHRRGLRARDPPRRRGSSAAATCSCRT